MPDVSEDLLSQSVGEALLRRSWMVCTAESCTGGLILHRLTNIPGCSAYVLGGVVAYANAIKREVLRVPQATLGAHGAVSEQTAEAMVRGALDLFGAQVGVSVTGIAGPGGGSEAKPVGLTYIAVAVRGGSCHVERHVWPGDRDAVKWASATRALELLLEAAT